MILKQLNKDKFAAWAVHGFTGSGAIMGFLAIISIFNDDAAGASSLNIDIMAKNPIIAPEPVNP